MATKTVDSVRKELKLALDQSTGGALSPESLEKHIVDIIQRLIPVLDQIKIVEATGAVHQFNRRTILPLGRFEGEGADSASQESTTVRAQVALKIMRLVGGVYGFTDAASRAFIDAYEAELFATARGLGMMMETAIHFGNASADQYQFDGFDKLIANRFDIGANGTLAHLDAMLDVITRNGGRKHQLLIELSPELLSHFSRLDPVIRKTVTEAPYAGGVRMASYRQAIMVEASGTRPITSMGAIVIADGGVPGSLTPGSTYRYRVSVVTVDGEQWASDMVSRVAPAAPNSSLKLSWSAFPNAISYKIFRDNGDGETLTHLTTIAAITYNAKGTPIGTVTSWTDTGAITYSSTNDRPMLAADKDEMMFCIDLDQDDGCEIAALRSTSGQKLSSLVTYEELAKTKDAREFMLKTYLALAVKNPNLHAVSRRDRIE